MKNVIPFFLAKLVAARLKIVEGHVGDYTHYTRPGYMIFSCFMSVFPEISTIIVPKI